ncbi:MAG: hypothetical protein PUC76_05705 [Clostridia bacterium]|nr:hypothetical protein [Clostridia bacterium]
MNALSDTMNKEVARKLLSIGEKFHIPGPFFSYEEVKMGNVNHTYKVNYIRDDGSGMAGIKSYLVQRVNTYAFQHPVELMRNIEHVTEHIRKSIRTGSACIFTIRKISKTTLWTMTASGA